MAYPKLSIKLDVRDSFDAPGCPAQRAFNTLGEIIGLKPSCNIEWDLLWNALRVCFPDNTSFVPNIASIVEAWCSALSTRLEDDSFAAWTAELVDRLAAAGAVKLRVEVSDDNRPTTAWSEGNSCFILSLPRMNSFSPHKASSGFATDFQNLFIRESSAESTESLPVRNDDEGWAEIDGMGETASIRTGKPAMTAGPDKLPAFTTLPTPEALLRNLRPYILHVTQKSSRKLVEQGSSRSINQGLGGLNTHGSSTQIEQASGKLVVQGTHEPTLQFLKQYLERWIKKDHQDVRKVPLLRITLQESHFGLGLSHDTLTIEPYDTRQQHNGVEVNPTIILAIIENVLDVAKGYRRLPAVAAGFWEFRREDAFE